MKISQLLSFTKNHLLNFKGGMSKNTFNAMTEKLKIFKEVKKSENPKKIIPYSTKIILSTGFWEQIKILNHIKYFYPMLRE